MLLNGACKSSLLEKNRTSLLHLLLQAFALWDGLGLGLGTVALALALIVFGLGLGQLALALSVLALLTSLLSMYVYLCTGMSAYVQVQVTMPWVAVWCWKCYMSCHVTLQHINTVSCLYSTEPRRTLCRFILTMNNKQCHLLLCLCLSQIGAPCSRGIMFPGCVSVSTCVCPYMCP